MPEPEGPLPETPDTSRRPRRAAPDYASLDPARIARAKAIFLAVQPLGLAGREEAVDRSCGDDPVIRALVVDLLQGDAAPLPYESLADDIRIAAKHVQTPAHAHAQAASSAPPSASTIVTINKPESATDRGDRIGPYRLLERLGEGGFGVVFAAEQTEPIKRTVALKVIKLGMDTRHVVARFEQERQALAIMDHPGIARVLDAGTTATGRPYFVMELVRGVPITDYCDRHKLSLRERLALMTQVCDALEHAHQKGVIHRDIKPSNILVGTAGDRPIPKIIDFGIAKATSARLTEKTIFTEMRQMIGTPEYMSPEQAGDFAEDIDTRTDVYSAGVLLYELLTGVTPFDSEHLRSGGYGAIQRIIREEDPPRPSTRVRSATDSLASVAALRNVAPDRLPIAIRGELDWIVMRAIEKDRTRRYESAGAFKRDIERFLAGEAVHAAPPDPFYVAAKLVRRNKGPFIAAALLLATLVFGLADTVYGLVNARRENAEALRLGAIAEASATAERSARQQAEYQAYIGNLMSAAAAMDNFQSATARERLNACPEPLRGWEWHRLMAITDDSIATLAHEGPVNGIAVSPAGDLAVGFGHEPSPRVWDLNTASLVRTLDARSWITSATFDQSGQRVLTGGFDNVARIFRLDSGLESLALRGHESGVLCAEFSNDQRRILTGSEDTTARIWTLDSSSVGSSVGKSSPIELTGHSLLVRSASFNPDNSLIVTASYDGTARVWDAATGQLLHILRSRDTDSWDAVAIFNHAGDKVAMGEGDGAVTIFDARSGRLLTTFKGHTIHISSLAFSRDDAKLLTASNDSTARLWDAATGQQLTLFKGHTHGVRDAEFSPDEARVVTASSDRTAAIWDANTGDRLEVLAGHGSHVNAARFIHGGQQVLTASSDRTARIWDASASNLKANFFKLKGVSFRPAFSPDSTRVVLPDVGGGVRVHSADTGELLSQFQWHDYSSVCADFSPDGNKVVCAGGDYEAHVWNAHTGEAILSLKGHEQLIAVARFSPDGSMIATGSEDHTARVWNATTGECLHVLRDHKSWACDVRFSPDGKQLLTASNDGTARIFDLSTGRVTASFTTQDADRGSSFATAMFTNNGKHVLSASIATADLWDAATGKLIRVVANDIDKLTGASMSPDGTRAISISTDGAAKIWDPQTGTQLAELKGHRLTIFSAVFSPDGTRILTSSADGTARIWNSKPFRERFPKMQTTPTSP